MIRVLLAEDQAMVRGALSALLSREQDIEVVDEVARGDKVVETALAARPDAHYVTRNRTRGSDFPLFLRASEVPTIVARCFRMLFGSRKRWLLIVGRVRFLVKSTFLELAVCLRDWKNRQRGLHSLSTTTPGPWRKAQIPVCMFSQWEENRPGFVEIERARPLWGPSRWDVSLHLDAD